MKNLLLISFLFYSFLGFSQSKTEKYISKYSSVALDEMERYGIPASITLAQGILESGNGENQKVFHNTNVLF